MSEPLIYLIWVIKTMIDYYLIYFFRFSCKS